MIKHFQELYIRTSEKKHLIKEDLKCFLIDSLSNGDQTTIVMELIRNRAPTFENKVRGEIIDLTLTTHHITDNIVNYRAVNEDCFSDYKYISFEIDSVHTKSELKRNPRKTNSTFFEAKIKCFFLNKKPPVVNNVVENLSDC